MLNIPNYEVALSALENEQGASVPIIALSFAWDDVAATAPNPWVQSECQMEIVDDGLYVQIGRHSLLFPLAQNPTQGNESGVGRSDFLSLLAQHQHLFVCAFDEQGDLIQSIGFQTQYH